MNPGHNNQPIMIDGKMVHIRQIRNTDEGVLYSHSITVSSHWGDTLYILYVDVHVFRIALVCLYQRYFYIIFMMCTTNTYYFQNIILCTPVSLNTLPLLLIYSTQQTNNRSDENQNDVQPS